MIQVLQIATQCPWKWPHCPVASSTTAAPRPQRLFRRRVAISSTAASPTLLPAQTAMRPDRSGSPRSFPRPCWQQWSTGGPRPRPQRRRRGAILPPRPRRCHRRPPRGAGRRGRPKGAGAVERPRERRREAAVGPHRIHRADRGGRARRPSYVLLVSRLLPG